MKRSLMVTTLACVLGGIGFTALTNTPVLASPVTSFGPVAPSGVLIINSVVTNNTCDFTTGTGGDITASVNGASVTQISDSQAPIEQVKIALTNCVVNNNAPAIHFAANSSQYDAVNKYALIDQGNITKVGMLLFQDPEGATPILPAAGSTLPGPSGVSAPDVTFYVQLTKLGTVTPQPGNFKADSNVVIDYQ